jgi:AcrR family transcriptional regulator
MDTRSRKERDLRQREDLFLDRARKVLLAKGYHGLTMDRIAKATGYSRGTIYQHFSCKEEIIVTLVARAMERRLRMMERAATFDGTTRERLQAVGEAVELFNRLYPDDAHLFHLSSAGAVKQKASEQALFRIKSCLQRSLNVATGIIRNAVALGDLVLGNGTTPEELTFSLWAITDGGFSLASGWTDHQEAGVRDPSRSIMHACEVLCDGYGWKPLSTPSGAEDTRRRVLEEIFPEEVRKMAIA